MANRKNKVEKDLFDSLPDHVVDCILNKVVDGKSLLRCLTVSKRFASLLSHINSATLEIQDIHDVTAVGGFVRRFNTIKSLHLKVPSLCFCGNSREECVFKWKVEYGLKFNYLVFLSLEEKEELDNQEEEEEEEEEEVPSGYRGHVFFHTTMAIRTLWRLEDVMNTKKYHQCGTKIGTIVITDLKEKGKIVFHRQSFIDTSKNKKITEQLLYETVRVPVHMKLWYVPQLSLPSSGYELKDATLGRIGRCQRERDDDCENKNTDDGCKSGDDYNGDCEDEDDDDCENKNTDDGCKSDDDYNGDIFFQDKEDKVYREAAAVILKNKSTSRGEFLDWSRSMWL